VGIGWGGGRRFGGIGFDSGRQISAYDEGLLVIDLIDASALLWRGTGTARADQHATPEEITKGIYDTVDKILAQFPPLPR